MPDRRPARPSRPERAHPTRRQQLLRQWWWWLSLLIAAMVFRIWLRADAPPPLQTRTQSLLQDAATALARGHLNAPDGSGALELYAAAQAIDPDLPEARRGQVAVGRAALARAQAALAQDDIAAARRDLALARQLQVPRAEWGPVDAALRAQALAEVSLEELLERAESAHAKGWLSDVPHEFPDASAALPLYQRILALQPGHAAALRGREDALGQLLDEARAALRTGDLDTAAAAIASARRYDPGHIDLPDTLARFTEERAAVQRQADAALAQGQLDAAIDGWQRLLALDPEDFEARNGLEHTARALAERAASLAESGHHAEAEHALARARALAPTSPALHAADVRLTRARQDQPDAIPIQSLQALGECFEISLAANHLGRARECLDASRAQGETVVTLNTRRRQLAQRWIAIGEERLGSGDLPAATAALTSARELDPTTPGLHALAQRLDTAQR